MHNNVLEVDILRRTIQSVAATSSAHCSKDVQGTQCTCDLLQIAGRDVFLFTDLAQLDSFPRGKFGKAEKKAQSVTCSCRKMHTHLVELWSDRPFCSVAMHGFETSVGCRKSSLSANEYTDIRPGDDTQTIVKSVCMTNIRSISDTQAVLNMQSVDRLVEMLRTSDRIFFFGMGASGLVCMDACQKFMRINKKAWYLTDSHTMRQTASLLTPDDMAIFISYSGTTAEIVSALDIALKTGTKTAAITKYSKGNIAAKTDVALYISSPEVTIRSGAMGSRIAMLNVIDIIFSVMASAEYDRIRQYLDNTHEALQ